MNQPPVGIGILNWNGRKYLEQFLPFLKNLSYPAYTVYVIDNASSDDSLEFVRAHHPWAKIIETGGNYGVAGGYNIGFAQMPEPYVLMLNSDVEVTAGFLEPLVEVLERDKKIAACQSKLLSYTNRDEFEYGGAAGGLIDVLGYTFCRGRIFTTVEKDAHQYQTGEIFWGGGACLLIRKTAYEAVKGMYEYYFMHFEEIDLCWKFHSAGYKVYYAADSVVYHMGGGSLSYQSPRKTYYNFKNNLVMCFRNSPLLYKLWWLPVRVMTDSLSLFFYLFKGEGRNAKAVLKAYAGFLAWVFNAKNKYPEKRSSLTDIDATFKHSIIAQYFLAGKKVYSAIRGNKQ
jgi:GT2 family glycosyltransferase